MAPVLILCWLVVEVVEGATCMLLLHPAPICTDVGPDLCTLCPDLTSTPLCACGGFTHCNLRQWYTFHSVTDANTLLANVVVAPSATCAGVFFLPTIAGANSALALKQRAL